MLPTTQLTVSQIGSSPNYQVTWNSTDDAGGSGVAYVNLYVSEDGGAYQIWQDQVTMASGTMIYQGQAGYTYQFLALATDVAGNHELPPAGTNLPQDNTTVNLGALPTVPNTTPPNFGNPPAPTVAPSTNPLFIQAQAGVPAAPPASNPSEFMTVLEPFQAQSFATGFPQSDGILGPMALVQEPDGSFLISGGASRNELFHVSEDGGAIGAPLAALPYQIFALAFDNEGNLWAATGGGPLLQLNPTTGAIVNEFGQGVTLALAVDPKTDQIYVATNTGVEIFDPTTDTFTQYSRDQNLRVSSLAFDSSGNLWAVTWPDASQVVEFNDVARAQVMLTFDSDIQSIAFGQQGTDLANLLFVSHDDAPDTPGGTVAPTPTELTMVDITTLQQVAIAAGGTRGFALLATSGGQLLISQSHEVDVLEPVVPPSVLAVNPPPGSIAALPLAFVDVTFDQDMFAGSAINSSSVTDPANYTLIGQSTGAATVESVEYNSNTRTALLIVSGLVADSYTLTVADSIQSANGLGLVVPYVTHFTTVSDLAPYVSLNFTSTRSDRNTGTVSFDVTITNTSQFNLLAPLLLILDLAPGFTGTPQNATESSSGSWLISLNSSVPGGVELQPGQSTTGTTVTLSDPDEQAIAYTTEVSGQPPAASAPAFDSTPPASVTAGSVYTYQAQAHDPDGSTPGFVLADGPAGMTVNPATGLLTWSTLPTSPATVSADLFAYDPSGSHTIQHFSIQVAGGSVPPVIGPLPAQVSGKEGQALVLPVTATDPDGRPLVYWAANLPGGALFNPTTHTLLWQPAYGQAGTYKSVIFYVSDGVSTVSSSISLLIAPSPPPPQFAPVPDQTVREGDHLRFTLVGSDADGGALTYSSADLPENATLDPNTGVFDWPIGYDQAGTLTVPFTVTSAQGIWTTVTATYTILAAPAAPVFVPLQSWQVSEGQPISFTAMAVDPHNPTFELPTRLPDGSLSPYSTTQPTVTYEVSGLPPGATFDPDTALFSWTPADHQNGTYNVVFTATNDGSGGPLSTSITVPITVLIVNHAPVVTPIADITLAAGQPFNQAVQAVDPDGNPITLSVENGIPGYAPPTFVTLTDNGNGNGILHFNPPAGNRGTYTLTVVATDNGDGLGPAGVLSGTYSFVVTVESPTQLPVLGYLGDQVAVAAQLFTLNLNASEADQDPLTYSVSGLPPAAVLTPGTTYGTATLDWTPTAADVGAHQVTFTVTDTGNGTTTQPSLASTTIRIVVRSSDTAPVVPAIATTATVAEGRSLSLNVTATKEEGDPLTYTATALPTGASLDPATGRLTWTPAPGQAGNYSVPVTASDGTMQSTETVNITVTHTDFAPQFVPLLPQYGREGTQLQFSVVADHVEGAPLLYNLTNVPAGAVFDASTGQFTWTPAYGQAGVYTLNFTATAPTGASASLSVVVNIAHVVRPPVLNTPNHQATLGMPLTFPIVATDLDSGTTLTYSAINPPSGAAVNAQTGQFRWTPGPSQSGDYVVTLEVSDGQATTTQNILIQAAVEPQLPSVTIVLTPSFPAIPGQQVVINAVASSVAPIASLVVTLNGQPLTLNANDEATVTAGAPGQSLITATATDDDGLVGTQTAYLQVRDPNRTTPPAVFFASSVPYAVLSSPTTILGTVASSNLASWSLQIATPSNPAFTVLASGTTPVSDGALGQLDPSELANGFYQLMLTATDLSGRTSTTTAQIQVDTATKPNDLVVTDADLSVDLDGTTVLIERTYDPLNRDGAGDFGAGWTLVNRQTDLQTNVPLTGEEAYGVYGAFSDGTEVYLTLSTGQRVRFTFTPTSFQVAGQTFFEPAWTADSGVTYTLQSTSAVLTKAGNSYYDLSTGQPYNPGNPFFSGPSYTLVAPDHTQYQLDENGNIIGEITPSGAQLHISDSRITAKGGETIQFLRNSQGFITSIVAPDGQVANYQYDSSGNLVSMQNPATGGSQRYGYSLSEPHLLTAAVRSNGDSVQYTAALGAGLTTPPTIAYIQRDLGDAAEFSGTTITNTLAAGTANLFSFRLDQAELDSTATGSILLRVLVQGSSGGLVPATPTIAGLEPLSVNTQGATVVALFPISQPGLYVVSVTGGTATMTGQYSLNVTVAGDLNGDGNVDGNDSALLAAALGSTAGSANYSLAADINGDGIVDQADEVILASDYGFHATTAAVPTTPPATPVFSLDFNSETPAGAALMTTDATVALVGTTDPNVTVTLEPTGATTTSNPNGLFVFLGVPLVLGDNTFTANATSADDTSSQFTTTITRNQPGLSLVPPVVTAQLADDTGVSALDNITSNDTVTGSITAVNPITSSMAQLDQSSVTSVLGALPGTTITITPALLETINGGPVADGKHTLTLLAKDSNGNVSQPVTVSFILLTTPPAPLVPVLLASSDTGTSSSDGITRDTTPIYEVDAPPNSIVTLYASGVQVGRATANNGPVFISTTTLAPGTYQMTATAEDVAGNTSTPAAPVTLVIQTAPPATPTLGLDAASASPAGQTTLTNLDVVNLTGTSEAGVSVALYRQWDSSTAIAQTTTDSSGNFTFTGIALAAGSQAFIVVATDVAGNTSELTRTITTTASDASPPVITAALALDTDISQGGGITSDPTITGVVDDPSGVQSFQASVDGGPMTDATSFLSGEGFTLTAADLATMNGGTALADGPHTIALQATDNLGYQSAVFHLSFTLESTRPLPPTDVQLLPADDTGSSDSDGITQLQSFTVEAGAPSGLIVTLYMQGTEVGSATSPASGVLDFSIPGPLADGQYVFTATAETVSGLVSPFSTPLRVTVETKPPTISFGLDPADQAPPYGQNNTVLPTVQLAGQTEPGATVELVQTGALTTADSSGDFTFYPVNLPSLGAFTFTVQATDVAGNVSSLSETFMRLDDTLPSNLLPPDVTLNVSQTTAKVGDTVTISVVTATHDGKPLYSEVFLINGSVAPLSAAGTTSFTSVTPGVFTMTVDAFDAEGNEGSATETITFLTPPNGLPAPVAGFNETQVTPVVTLPTAIMGTANTPDLLDYTLQYSIEGQNQWTTFATGTSPVVNGTLGTIDPTMMVNGFYDVRLTVEDTSGQVSTADQVYNVSGQAKLGNFTLSYNDMSITVPGVLLMCPHHYSCSDWASKCRSNSSPRDMKETELFEDGLRRDPLDLGLGVMRERGCWVDHALFQDSRDLAP